jgi:hypothetical protein
MRLVGTTNPRNYWYDIISFHVSEQILVSCSIFLTIKINKMLTTFDIMYNILEGPDGHMESVYKDLILMTLPVINIISLQKLPVHYVPSLLFIVVKTIF